MAEIYDRYKAGERLRNKRKNIGWSQERAAEMMNLSAKYYADIERGTCGMSIETLATLCNVYQMSADMILFGEESSERFIEDKVDNAQKKVGCDCPANCSYMIAKSSCGNMSTKCTEDTSSNTTGTKSRKSRSPKECPLGEDYKTCNKIFLARSHADMKVFFNNEETGAVLEVFDNTKDVVREHIMNLLKCELEFSEKLKPTVATKRGHKKTSRNSKGE